jgi:regulator of sirC expression with transglutaminase-like and TPR domain
MNQPVVDSLRQMLALPEEEVDLARASLLIAQGEYPELDIEVYLKRLRRWSDELRDRLSEGSSAASRVFALNEFLFNELGFRGNVDDYYDPRNSFLNEVIDRRMGIPITLSIIYIYIGRRIGLPLEGVSFPGHFLVKFAVDNGEVIIDPFSAGASLEESDIDELLQQYYGEDVSSHPPLEESLAGVDIRTLLIRVLHNLKGIYLRDQELEKALSVINISLTLNPQIADDLRDRGEIYMKLECYHAAMHDLRLYLELEPDADDMEEIRGMLIDMQRMNHVLH